MNGFVGHFEHQMDQKGRVSLPSAFRREADGDRFVLLQWEPRYLTLLPEEKWNEIQTNLLEFRRSEPQAWHSVRTIIANAVEVSPDKQGRILVPAALQEAAELSGSVLLLGNLDRIELWDPGVYREVVEGQAAEMQQFAHKLFG